MSTENTSMLTVHPFVTRITISSPPKAEDASLEHFINLKNMNTEKPLCFKLSTEFPDAYHFSEVNGTIPAGESKKVLIKVNGIKIKEHLKVVSSRDCSFKIVYSIDSKEAGHKDEHSMNIPVVMYETLARVDVNPGTEGNTKADFSTTQADTGASDVYHSARSTHQNLPDKVVNSKILLAIIIVIVVIIFINFFFY